MTTSDCFELRACYLQYSFLWGGSATFRTTTTTRVSQILKGNYAKTQSGLKIIDFSSLRSGTDKTLYSHDRFISAWKWTIYTMFHCSVSSYKIYNIEHLAKRVKRIDWLHSKQALLNLMQRVCTATDKWLATAAAECANQTIEPHNTSFARGASLPLTSFKKIAPPTLHMPCRGHYEIRSMLREYDRWLDMWNVQLCRWFEWFPLQMYKGL